jgi:hypothetical protein
MDHGKPGADFQRVDYGTGDIAGTPDTARDRRLTPGDWANPDRRRGLVRVPVVIGLRRFDRQLGTVALPVVSNWAYEL